MTEHLSSHTIELLTVGALSPAQLLTATRHLATCVECRQKASERAGVPGRTQQLRAQLQPLSTETSHPDYEQLEAYLEDSLPFIDRETLKRHFDSCAPCLNEVHELEALRDNLKTYPAVAGPTATLKGERESSWQRITALLWMRPAQFALLTVTVALIAIIVVLMIKRSPTPLATKDSAPPNNNEANQNSQVAAASPNASNEEQPTPNGAGNLAAAAPYQSMIKQTIDAQKVSPPSAIRDLIGKESKLLGASEEQDRFALVSPLGTVIRSTRPTFRWQTLPGVNSYSVAILDSQLDVVEQSSPTGKASWTPLHPLKRNVVYIWQVTALKDGREVTAPAAPAREARFKILSAEKTATLTPVTTELAGSHLKLGIVYAHEGLLDDAEQEFRAAIAVGEDSALARKLLQSVRQMRRS
jgi:hypothetical protein